MFLEQQINSFLLSFISSLKRSLPWPFTYNIYTETITTMLYIKKKKNIIILCVLHRILLGRLNTFCKKIYDTVSIVIINIVNYLYVCVY